MYAKPHVTDYQMGTISPVTVVQCMHHVEVDCLRITDHVLQARYGMIPRRDVNMHPLPVHV